MTPSNMFLNLPQVDDKIHTPFSKLFSQSCYNNPTYFLEANLLKL